MRIARISPGRIPSNTAIRKMRRSRGPSTPRATRISSGDMTLFSPSGLHGGVKKRRCWIRVHQTVGEGRLENVVEVPPKMVHNTARECLGFLVQERLHLIARDAPEHSANQQVWANAVHTENKLQEHQTDRCGYGTPRPCAVGRNEGCRRAGSSIQVVH